MFSGGTKVWSLGANLLQPLFHGGTLRAQKRATEAGLDKAAADYQTTVLGAFQNVADSLHALELDAEKMSKSLGNVVTLRNVLDTWGREALLVFHLTGHWSKPVDFSDEAMEAAAARAEGFRDVFRTPSEPAARPRRCSGSSSARARR